LVNDSMLLLGLDGVEVTRVELDRERNPVIALVTAAGQQRD
jgi:hypothetical protein